MGDLETLDQLKAMIVAAWDAPFRRDNEAVFDGPQLQTLFAPLPPRGGLAIGHGVDPETGEIALEFRVTASAGPDMQRAEQLAAKARLEGISSFVRSFMHLPQVRLGPTKGGPVLPRIAGRRQPLHIGASIAHEMGFAGTLGAFVTLKGGAKGLVSCAHVLAEAPRAKIGVGDAVQQPGQPDAIPIENRIGTLSAHFSRFVPARTDNLDAAIALLDEGVETNGNRIPDCAEIPAELRGRALGAPLTREEVVIGTSVLKVGRTSGVTRGVLSAADFQNFRPELTGRRRITFGRVHEVSWLEDGPAFTEAGDSGSLVVTEHELRPIGIHFCAVPFTEGKDRSYMIPWDRIVETFPIELDPA